MGLRPRCLDLMADRPSVVCRAIPEAAAWIRQSCAPDALDSDKNKAAAEDQGEDHGTGAADGPSGRFGSRTACRGETHQLYHEVQQSGQKNEAAENDPGDRRD